MTGNIKKGIILAGGQGTRLYPLTRVACKQLLPIYNKPMIYYPLATLMQMSIREILIISTPRDLPQFKDLLGDGGHLGLSLQYAVQEHPDGIAQSFLIGESFVGGDPVALILGDNVFHGTDTMVREAAMFTAGATIFGFYMKNPERYGVIEFSEQGEALSIVEKPDYPLSNYAVTGLYLYDNKVIEIARGLKPSQRRELEITDVNNAYLNMKKLRVVKLERDVSWMDTGTHDSLLAAGNFIAAIESRQGMRVGCIEEIAFRRGFIDKTQFGAVIRSITDSSYRGYLQEILKDSNHAG